MASLLKPLCSLLLLGFLVGSHARVLVQDATLHNAVYGSRDADQDPAAASAQVQNQNHEQLVLLTDDSKQTLRDLITALDVMQDSWFVLWEGTWPSGNDWTRAVHGTHVSATIAALTTSTDDKQLGNLLANVTGVDIGAKDPITTNSVALENLVSRFFGQVTTFYFGENAFALRNQAYDDMLWVTLGWLENIKFQVLHSDLHYGGSQGSERTGGRPWHGTQFQASAAHRVRIFYELASEGWDRTLCGGGMIWNPHLGAYKNAITNELFISASIGMYLYFPGDKIDAPFVEDTDEGGTSEGTSNRELGDGLPHDPYYLEIAQEAYSWLKNSNMTGIFNLYGDGFHIRGYQGPDHPGTKKCDVLNTMVYTYNQGVVLSGLRGLWLATGEGSYLSDGHTLIQNVQRATGWPNIYDQKWSGLGRAGIIEDSCDANGDCSQDGQTFKGIFWHHFAEFCRPFRPQEERFLRTQPYFKDEAFQHTFQWHQDLCSTYRPWIERNAEAALVTRNEEGKFGTWWGKRYRVIDDQSETSTSHNSPLPNGATDYRNHPDSAPPYFETNSTAPAAEAKRDTEDAEDAEPEGKDPEYNDRGRGRTVETQSGGVAVLRALWQWKTAPSLSGHLQSAAV
ncbi:putative glycosyl hydrolase [Aspergillus stella-maris]|uniref:putative glycosyl hydrolase n=1 Tax=Aspergillus stella-maris TaxID=1810926 RepID=UPI003CCD9AB1